MIDRYTRREMKQVWSEQYKFLKFFDVEMAVLRAMRKLDKIPFDKFMEIKDHMTFSIEEIHEIEQETHHDVLAFLTNLSNSIGENSKYLHKGMTSSDVVDTALALQIKEAGRIILNDFVDLIKVLKKKALQYKDTVCVGRTHGMHAEPITFGLKILNWLDSIERVGNNFELSLSQTQVGKVSGAVGTYSSIDPRIEEITCEILGLKPSKISTQIISRDIHAQFVQSLALIACVIERIATEFRHLQRTEINEVYESFAEGQQGSSAMPHKKNPITSENLCGLARIVRSNSIAAMESVALWHERDISHSSVERIILPDSTILIDYMLHKLTKLIENMSVNDTQMFKNLSITRGANCSSKLLVALCEKGLPRSEAYRIVQELSFNLLVATNCDEVHDAHNEIMKYLTVDEINECRTWNNYLTCIDSIYSKFDLEGENNE